MHRAGTEVTERMERTERQVRGLPHGVPSGCSGARLPSRRYLPKSSLATASMPSLQGVAIFPNRLSNFALLNT